ncbi:uncharacterized protein LOC142322704 [Lycorma delicatula]|uniref:uncharacterized protein LOC142322704 n=1 Tax=Lycorma delicatula TaxID=130591 RepID=UPI003F5187B5
MCSEMDVPKPMFPPESYSTSYNLRDEIKQYLIKKGLAIFPNGVMVARNKCKDVVLNRRLKDTFSFGNKKKSVEPDQVSKVDDEANFFFSSLGQIFIVKSIHPR